MSDETVAPSEIVSGATREEIFFAFYHGLSFPLKIGDTEVSAKVARVVGTLDSGVFGILFRIETPGGISKHALVPRYDMADAKGGELLTEEPLAVA